jgi:hypothetical protein
MKYAEPKMREIKFRAWDKVRRTWVYFYMFNGQQPTPLYDGNFLWDDLEPWQQFTGLCDKNGKECFEGDVLRHRSNGGKWSAPAEVKWRDTAFELAMVPMRNIVFPRTEIEIIGNIYQNPDLLTSHTSAPVSSDAAD